MKVTLHQPAAGHAAGDTVDIDDDYATWLVDNGYAVKPGDKSDKTTRTENPPTTPTVVGPAADGAFDPSEHSVDEVKAYLAEADDAERDRVLAAERDGKARKSLVGE